MSEHYPKLRIYSTTGYLGARDGLSLCFYMPQPFEELAPSVMAALDSYVRAIGPHELTWYTDSDGYWWPLDDANWTRIRRGLLERLDLSALLRSTEKRFWFEYRGKCRSELDQDRNWVSAVRFLLPTEYLEEHGPERVRALALELADPLPFCSGHAGLSFQADLGVPGVPHKLREICFRYSGMDILDFEWTASRLGTRVNTTAWLTFLGQPVLGEVGGVDGLRARLHAPGVTVQEMSGARAVVTLGEWPEAGDTEKGLLLPPAYRELAALLEPWHYHRYPHRFGGFSDEDMRRWEDRFLG